MQFLNAKIDRIIIHQIYKKNKDEDKKAPYQGEELTLFEDNALRNFTTRFDDAIGANSKAVKMLIDIEKSKPLLSELAIKALHDTDGAFIKSSFDIAKKLDDAQTRASYPDGIVVIFNGTCNYNPPREFIGVIKAETHSGYEKLKDSKTGRISLKYINEVVLTPGTKLYKTAAFMKKRNYNKDETDLNKNWEVWVSDSQVSGSDGKAASDYFLKAFLGFTYPETSARKTKAFYETTMSYIESLDLDAEQKNNYMNALTTYMKVDKSNIIYPLDFALKYFEDDHKTEYKDFLEEHDVDTDSIVKDIEHIKSKLKFRRLHFRGRIRIEGPPEEFKEKVVFEEIDGDEDKKGNKPRWTKVIIKEQIINQE